MSIAGMRGTDDWVTDEAPNDFREMILWRDPNGETPLTALMSKMRSEKVGAPEYHWWEETLKIVRLQINGALLVGDTAFVVDEGALDAVAGDLFLVEVTTTTSYAHEIVRVTADPTTDTGLTMARGQLGTTAAGIADNVYITKIGNINEEGSNQRTATTRSPTKHTNYLQIFKDTYNMSGTVAAQTTQRTGDPLANDKKRKMFDHATAQELAYLFGVPWEGTGATGEPMRSTGGLLHYLSTQRAVDTTLYGHCISILTGATATVDDLLDTMSPCFDWNANGAGNERIILAGNGWINRTNKIVKAAVEFQQNGTMKTFGMKLARLEFPQGNYYMRSHPLMNNHPRYTNGAFVINPAGIRHRYLPGRDSQFQDNIQANGADRKEGQWWGEVGAEFHHLPTMQYIEYQ